MEHLWSFDPLSGTEGVALKSVQKRAAEVREIGLAEPLGITGASSLDVLRGWHCKWT
jgi:hypothetical protein